MTALSNGRARGAGQRLRLRVFLLVALALVLPGCTLGSSPSQDLTTSVSEFGANPGDLRMYKYVPASLPPSPAMVVVLHHCFQHAYDYIEEAGWRPLADRYGFILLLPQQTVGNNVSYCFDFYSAEAKRGQGEGESIREMIEKMVADHNVDRSRIFVTGLSSGGSMTLMMMAEYPEIFAGGGEVGGVPFGCARGIMEVADCQTTSWTRTPRQWGDLVRAASPSRGPWPILSVWHGPNDVISVPANAQAIVQQWTNVNGAPSAPTRQDKVEGYPHFVYVDPTGRPVVEYYQINGMGHSVPVDPARGCGDGREGVGNFVSNMHICSSFYMLKFWGLVGPDETLALPVAK